MLYRTRAFTCVNTAPTKKQDKACGGGDAQFACAQQPDHDPGGSGQLHRAQRR